MTSFPLKALIAAMGVIMLALLAPTSASAADGLSLSSDGSSWRDSLDTPLFDEGILWVPGDDRTATFFVRNDSRTDAEMQVDFLSTPLDDLIETGDLQVRVSVDDAGGVATSKAGPQRLSTSRIAAGTVRAVEVRVTLPWAAPLEAQSRQLDFGLRVTLSGEDAELPPTGGTLDLVLLVAAGGAVTLGGTITIRGRRRRRHDRLEEGGIR